VSKLLGKETIDTNTYGQSKGRSGSYSTNWQITGRELLMPDEVRMLDNRQALLFIRGERAIRDEKYDLLRHPNIKMTADGEEQKYVHGQAPLALDIGEILLDGSYEDYIVLSEEELEELIENNDLEDIQNV
jgi:type IV secretion system protein VirD4